ncbi:MAG: hypothetical protein ACLRM9_08140 [Collinsella aerofaciens]
MAGPRAHRRCAAEPQGATIADAPSSSTRRNVLPGVFCRRSVRGAGHLGITAMQNRFLALIGGEGGAAAASSVFEIPAMVRAPPAMPRRLPPLPPRSLARLTRVSGLPPWWTMTRRKAHFLA